MTRGHRRHDKRTYLEGREIGKWASVFAQQNKADVEKNSKGSTRTKQKMHRSHRVSFNFVFLRAEQVWELAHMPLFDWVLG